MRIAADRSLIPSSAVSVRYLSISVTAPVKARRTERPAANVGLVLDRSGSMGGSKIGMAREAVVHAVRLLDTRDQLAVVVYDDRVDTLLESTTASPEAQALAIRRLKDIDARGSTDLHGGWTRGADEVSRTPPAGATARLLLLTDGQANVGVTDSEALAGVAAALLTRGIRTSTFGVGADFDEELLARIATQGGGNFYFIERAQQIPDVLTSELGETLDVVANDAEVVVSGGPGLELVLLNDFRSEALADGLHVKLGDLVSGQVVQVVVALRWAARGVGMPASADCRMSDRDGHLFPEPMRVEWTTADSQANAAQPVNAEVVVAAAAQIAARARAEALAGNRAGRFDEAVAVLKAAAAEIRAIGGGIPEVERIANELEQDEAPMGTVLNSMALKERHFSNYSARRSRGAAGKAHRASSTS